MTQLTPRALAVAMLLACSAAQATDWVSTPTKALVPPAGTPVTALSPGKIVPVTVSLTLRNKAALDQLVRNQSIPGNPQYGMYLTPAQFRDQFAPTDAQAQAVAAYLKSQGFTSIRISKSNTLVGGRAPKATVERAFNTQLAQVTLDGRTAYLNTKDAQVPASLAPFVLSVSGLQSVVRMKTDLQQSAERQGYKAPITADFAVPSEQQFGPEDFQKGYDVGTTTEGSNTVIAISAYGDDLTQVIADLRVFEAAHHLPFIPVEVRQEAPIPDEDVDTGGDGEWDLDSQYSTGMAGNVKKLVFYTADDLTGNLLWQYEDFASDASADHPTVGNMSYGTCDVLWPVTTANFGDPIGGIFTFLPDMASADQQFEAAAAEGRSWHASSGDSGGSCSPGNFEAAPDTGLPGGTEYPASSPFVTSVGGTSLFTDDNGNYAEETVWTSGGGGVSYVEPAPAWQVGIVPSAVADGAGQRGVPDLALDAGLLLISQCANVSGASAGCYLGTSLSSPLAVGVYARLQTSHCNQLGFAAPQYYALSTTSAPFTATGFNDVLIGTNGFWTAAPGWDYTTGFGSPDVAKLDAALPGAGGCTPLSAAPGASGSASVDNAHKATIKATGHGADPIQYFVVDFGDDPTNVLVQPASRPNFEHTYKLPGHYNATVYARNAHGVVSPGVAVAVDVPGVPAACSLPGLPLVLSPAGSASLEAGQDVGQGTDDLLSTSFAQPNGSDRLIVTMKVATLDPSPLPGFRWVTYFKIPEDAVNEYFVAMDTANGPTPVFIYGTRSLLPGAGASVYTVLGDLDPASNYTADGTITLVLPLATLGLSPGDVLTGISSATRTSSPEDPSGSAPSGAGLTQDAASGLGNYPVIAASDCVDNSGNGPQLPPVGPNGPTGPIGPAGKSKGVILGGALGWATLLPLVAAGALRRRRYSTTKRV